MVQPLNSKKESLQETVLVEELNVGKSIRQLVLDNDLFWMSINSLVNMIKPICDGISLIESDVPHVFLSIKQSLESLVLTPLQTNEEEAVSALVEMRQAAICTPIHYAGYILDPRYIEKDLPNEYIRFKFYF